MLIEVQSILTCQLTAPLLTVITLLTTSLAVPAPDPNNPRSVDNKADEYAIAAAASALGITANAIAPGPTATELFFEGKSEAMVKGIASQSPFNRLGKPEEVAELAAFVAGPESAWVSGQIIGANGASFV